MKKRCYQPNCIGYPNYGGRGILVCDDWRDNFAAFREWSLANGYKEGLTLDRTDNDQGYSPDNCRWVTSLENNWNRRCTRIIEIDGERMPLSVAAKRYHIGYDRLKQRLYAGYSPEDAIKQGIDPLGRRAICRLSRWPARVGAASQDDE